MLQCALLRSKQKSEQPRGEDGQQVRLYRGREEGRWLHYQLPAGARFAWFLWQQRGWFCCDVVQEEKVEQRCITYMLLIMNERDIKWQQGREKGQHYLSAAACVHFQTYKMKLSLPRCHRNKMHTVSLQHIWYQQTLNESDLPLHAIPHQSHNSRTIVLLLMH